MFNFHWLFQVLIDNWILKCFHFYWLSQVIIDNGILKCLHFYWLSQIIIDNGILKCFHFYWLYQVHFYTLKGVLIIPICVCIAAPAVSQGNQWEDEASPALAFRIMVLLGTQSSLQISLSVHKLDARLLLLLGLASSISAISLWSREFSGACRGFPNRCGANFARKIFLGATQLKFLAQHLSFYFLNGAKY